MLTSLLTGARLTELLALNSERLSASYKVFAEGFQRLGVDFIRPSEGLFVFAKIGKRVKSRDEENEMAAGLEQHGLRVSPGWLYYPATHEFGWARITIAVPKNLAEDSMHRLSMFLESLK